MNRAFTCVVTDITHVEVTSIRVNAACHLKAFVVLAKLPKVFATPYNWLPLIASVDCAFTTCSHICDSTFTVSLPTLSVESAEPPA